MTVFVIVFAVVVLGVLFFVMKPLYNHQLVKDFLVTNLKHPIKGYNDNE